MEKERNDKEKNQKTAPKTGSYPLVRRRPPVFRSKKTFLGTTNLTNLTNMKKKTIKTTSIEEKPKKPLFLMKENVVSKCYF